ncbi:glycosyltransferase family 2 protein [Paenibacillus tianjinensis]|uniref:Glycosyltransferase family 2 protein n=1 Tax=Paenibacillus tianjinensis TaxID=2810347 RepID=A0ABX7L7D1_9BACL|nr:glycosyltransferase family 2 protein [Paenibacillus tianjinensis]QSF44112.1 glycosyltransferase family 2 protein [Paenibacillus tianjinensis]
MHKKKVCAIFVLYNPNIPELINNLKVVLPQVDHAVIIDNSEKSENVNYEYCFSDFDKVQYFAFNKNRGIGAAQNKGMELAFNEGFEAVLIMDQDSHVPPNLVEELLNGAFKLKSAGYKIACIGPIVYNRDTGETYKPLFHSKMDISDFIKKDAIISSGSLILREAYEVIGGMEVGLFIDNVDFEWCWRAKREGYSVFVSKRIEMAHRVGERDLSIFNLFSLQVSTPIRLYYQFRNTIILLPRAYVPRYWKIRSILIKPIEFIVFSLFIGPRSLRMKMMVKGIKHGLLKKMGEMID